MTIGRYAQEKNCPKQKAQFKPEMAVKVAKEVEQITKSVRDLEEQLLEITSEINKPISWMIPKEKRRLQNYIDEFKYLLMSYAKIFILLFLQMEISIDLTSLFLTPFYQSRRQKYC